jgi:hypothetical protein
MPMGDVFAQAVHGVVDLAMAADAGVAASTMRRRAEAEGWRRLHAGTWLLPTHEACPVTRLVAAQRRLGPAAVADRHTALALAGVVPVFPTRPQLLLPHARRVPVADGIDLRRTRRLQPKDTTHLAGRPSVTVARALLDLARDLRTAPLRSLALASVRDGHLDPAELGAAIDRHPAAPGRRRALQVLHDVSRDGSESGLEFRTRTRVLQLGLRPDDAQPTVVVNGRRRRVDVAWVALRVAIECHGYRHHAGPAALDRDTARMNELVADGDWVVLQVTEATLRDGWGAFAGLLRQCLRRRATQLGLPVPAGC